VKIAQIPNNQLFRLATIFTLLVIAALIPREFVFDETHSVCIHYYLLGFQCPLCGMTRAVYEFSHLHFSTAIKYNLVVALLPLYLVMDIATLFFKRNWLLQVRRIFVLLIISALIMLYVFRIIQHFNL